MVTKRTMTTLSCAFALLASTIAALAQETAPAQPATAPTTAERVTAIKANLAQSQKNIKQYQWLEKTVVNYKGEDKSSTQDNCYYGADGTVVKTPVQEAAPAEDKRGLRGKVVADKKAEMADYMKDAVALVKTYIPPDPTKIQAAKDAGKISMTVLEPGKRAKIDIKDYEKPGDDLGIEIDLTTNQILGLSVASYLTDTTDTVDLAVTMAALADGTGYAATSVLNCASKEMKVTITNSGYQKKAN